MVLRVSSLQSEKKRWDTVYAGQGVKLNCNYDEEMIGLGKGSQGLVIRGLRKSKSHLNLSSDYVSTRFKYNSVKFICILGKNRY